MKRIPDIDELAPRGGSLRIAMVTETYPPEVNGVARTVALIAEGLSLITQVVLRKGDKLYINDGTYGSFDELTLPGWTGDYPTRVFTADKRGRISEQPAGTAPYRVYGPTCDTLDVLPRRAVAWLG